MLQNITNDNICEQKELPVKTDGCGVEVSTSLNTIYNRVWSFLLSTNHRNARETVGYMTIIKKMTVISKWLEPNPWKVEGNVLSLQQIVQIRAVGP
jgi:hypothetical protein